MLNRVRTAVTAILTTSLVILLYVNWSSGETRLKHVIHAQYEINSPDFRRSMNRLLGPPLTPGNRIQALHNGEEIFPAMLEAIRQAKQSITFEIYIYWKGEIGRQFTEELCR